MLMESIEPQKKELLDNVPALFSTAEAMQAGKEVGLSERSVMYMFCLLYTSSTEINLPYIMPVGGVPKHLVKTLTRAKFESLAHELIQACLVNNDTT